MIPVLGDAVYYMSGVGEVIGLELAMLAEEPSIITVRWKSGRVRTVQSDALRPTATAMRNGAVAWRLGSKS